MEWVKQSGHRDDVIRNMMAMRAIIDQMKSLELLKQKLLALPDWDCAWSDQFWKNHMEVSFYDAYKKLGWPATILLYNITRMFDEKVNQQDMAMLFRKVIKFAGLNPDDKVQVWEILGTANLESLEPNMTREDWAELSDQLDRLHREQQQKLL